MMMGNQHQPPTSGFQYASPAPSPQEPQLPEKNNVEMTRDMLIQVLEYFSTIIPAYFDNRPVRLVIHGGACMLLHPRLFPLTQSPPMSQSLFVGDDGMPIPIPAKRTATRDVDYINRSFAAEWKSVGVVDATERLKKCIRTTARRFGLGADWMNSDADIALPMATNAQTGTVYDPIYTDSLRPNNLHLHTIFTSRNQQLVLISVTPFWAVALKLVRYCKWDPGDICALLRNGTIMSKVTWSAEILEGWLHKECWPMGYASYDTAKVMEMRKRIQHAVQMVNAWNASDPLSSSSHPTPTPSSSYGTISASSSRFAPEAWSMGGQGTDPASPPVNGAWSMSPSPPGSSSQMPPSWGAAGSPPPPILSHQPSTQWNTPPSTLGRSSARDSWVGGWALPLQNTGSSTHSSLHMSTSMTFPSASRSGQEANVPGVGVPAASNSVASQSSSLGITLGRQPSWEWDQRRAVDSASNVAVVSAHEEARRRHWDSDSRSTRSEASETWRHSLTRDMADITLLQSSQSAPVIPTFDYGANASDDAYNQGSRLMKPRTRSGDDASVRLSTHVEGDVPPSFGLPPGFVAGEEYKSQWDWYGLTDAEKEMIISERRRKAAASASLRGGEYLHQQEPEPAPVIPFDTSMEKTPLSQPRGFLDERGGMPRESTELRHRKSMSSLSQHPNYAQAWHPDTAELAARARERDMARLMAASPAVVIPRPQANDEDIWRPFHGRGVAADNIRQSQSLGMI